MDAAAHAQRLVSRPAAIHAPGPRPLTRRRLANVWHAWIHAGLASSLLLIQALQPAFGASAVDAYTQVASVAPPGTRAPAQSDRPPPSSPAAPVLFNPLLQIASARSLVLPGGAIDAMAMIQRWQEAGVSPAHMHLLTQLMLVSQAPVFVRTPEDRAAARALSARTAGMFSLASDNQAATLLAREGMEALLDAGQLSDSMVMANLRLFHQPGRVTAQAVEDYWRAASVLITGQAPEPLRARAHDPGIGRAQAAMAAAMDEAGLARLVVPLPLWTSSSGLEQAANAIQRANAELQALTGWSGPVLGLDGRVGLSLGNPNNVALTQYQAGRVDIQARFSDLAHEWIHALDIVVGWNLGRVDPGCLPVMMSGGPADRPLVATWQGTYRALERTSRTRPGSWFVRMDALAADTVRAHPALPAHVAGYFAAPHERLAYAFASHAAAALSGASTVLAHPDNVRDDNNPLAVGPSLAEARAQAGTWGALFATLGRQWWHPVPTQASSAPIVRVGCSPRRPRP